VKLIKLYGVKHRQPFQKDLFNSDTERAGGPKHCQVSGDKGGEETQLANKSCSFRFASCSF